MQVLCRPLVAVFLLAATPLFSGPAQAARATDNCTAFIESLPVTITTPGTWCLRSDLATYISFGSAIQISTNNVTIDCNNFKIEGTASRQNTQARGIAHSGTRTNATVRNCDVRGFFQGVELRDAVIEDNRFADNAYLGIFAWGDGSQVRRNLVIDSGGTSVTPVSFGIYTYDGVDVVDNTVSGVIGGLDAYGIAVDSNPFGSVVGNRVRGVSAPSKVRGIAGAYDAGRLTIRDNHVSGLHADHPDAVGIECGGQGRALGNVVAGFPSALVGCRDDGNSL